MTVDVTTLTRELVCDACTCVLPDFQVERGLLTACGLAVDRDQDVEVWLMCWRCSLRLTIVSGGSV